MTKSDSEVGPAEGSKVIPFPKKFPPEMPNFLDQDVFETSNDIPPKNFAAMLDIIRTLHIMEEIKAQLIEEYLELLYSKKRGN